MWEDYKIFKAAGLLNEWRRKMGGLPAKLKCPYKNV